MARITIEDCLPHVANRFELTLVAAHRARQLSIGATPYIEQERGNKEKPTVIALREIAAGHVGADLLARIATGNA